MIKKLMAYKYNIIFLILFQIFFFYFVDAFTNTTDSMIWLAPILFAFPISLVTLGYLYITNSPDTLALSIFWVTGSFWYTLIPNIIKFLYAKLNARRISILELIIYGLTFFVIVSVSAIFIGVTLLTLGYEIQNRLILNI